MKKYVFVGLVSVLGLNASAFADIVTSKFPMEFKTNQECGSVPGSLELMYDNDTLRIERAAFVYYWGDVVSWCHSSAGIIGSGIYTINLSLDPKSSDFVLRPVEGSRKQLNRCKRLLNLPKERVGIAQVQISLNRRALSALMSIMRGRFDVPKRIYDSAVKRGEVDDVNSFEENRLEVLAKASSFDQNDLILSGTINGGSPACIEKP